MASTDIVPLDYSEFKNYLKSHLKKHDELRGPNSISAEHWSKFIEYNKDPYIQVLKYLIVLFSSLRLNC